MRPAGSLLFLLWIFSVSVFGQILNRSFELAAPVEPNGPPVYFTSPLYWNCENYAEIRSGSFDPNNDKTNWTIPGPYEGDYYLLLSTGGFGPYEDIDIARSTVCQRIYLPARTLIQGVYFFGTCDWKPFSDTGAIELIPHNDPNDPNAPYLWNSIPLVQCSVDKVGNYGSTEDWQAFSYLISPEEEGYYDLTLSVQDGKDNTVESYLAVDDLRICGPGVLLGDLCPDCRVDLQDLSLFSKEWLEICPTIDPNVPPDPNDPNIPSDPNVPVDPNNIIDPNCLCIYADFTRDKKVDVNDLDLFQKNWLLDNL
jgi:hypothetical protein